MGKKEGFTGCNQSREVEPVGVDKEEEDTEEDKHVIVRRKERERNDHKRES